MEEYLLQGPPAYKRPRLGDSLQPNSPNFLDARGASMVPYGFVATQERGDGDMSMAAMPMGGNLALNPVHSADFNQLPVLDWRHVIPPDARNRFVHKISQALIHNARNGENADNRSPKWIAAARKIEGKAFKTATSRSQYFNLVKEEIHKIQSGYGFPAMSSQFPPSSSTTSASAANNMQLGNMPQNYGPNNFGESVTSTQSHSQPGIAHSVTSASLFSDEGAVGGAIRIPVTSSMGSTRPQQYEAFNGRQPGPRSMVHDQVPGSSIPIGFAADPGQFMSSAAEQVLAPNLLHSMNAIMSSPLNQFMPSSSVGSQQQQRFGGLNEPGQGVLSENSSIVNSQLPGRMSQSKEWHKSVTFNVRNRLIRKMAQIFSTIPDPQGGTLENRMQQCISIANNVENEVYRNANSMTQYYDLMAKRCYVVAKERASLANPASMQYFNLSDIRRTYEALGITFPPLPYPGEGSANGGNGNASGGGSAAANMRLHGNEVVQAPLPPPGPMMSSLMGSAAGAAPMAYGFPRGPATQPGPMSQQQSNHGQLLGSLPLSMDTSDMSSMIKQLAHAYKCQEREIQENDVMLLCSLPYCRDAKNLLNHMLTCQIGIGCSCSSTKEVVEHWNHCSANECNLCLPLRQAERSLSAAAADARSSLRNYQHRFLPTATATSLNSAMNMNPAFMRRQHGRNMSGSNYSSTATSGLLSNQSPSGGPVGPNSSIRNDRISPRNSCMWYSSYNDHSWRSNPCDGNALNSGAVGVESPRRNQSRFFLHNRSSSSVRHDRRAPYNNPWGSPDIIFMENARSGFIPAQPPPPRGGGASLFGRIPNVDRLEPFGLPWRSPEILYVENARPAHRPAQDADEPVIIPPEEDPTPTEHQQIMAIVKVLKTHGGRLEQKFRCSRRSCNAAWPCLHRRLAASIQSLETPSPG